MIFNIKTQGRIFQKVNYDVLKKNYVSKEKKRNQDDNCFHQGHNRMKKMKLLKAQISSKESNPNSFVLNKSCSKSGINGNNQISREDFFRKNIERKNLIKKSFYIESKLNSDVSENISMNGLLNLTPNTLIKNKSNPLLVKYKSNQKRNLNDNRENLNFLSSNDDKKDQFRSSSNNIINTSYVVNRKKIDNNIKKQCLEKKILDDKEFISKGRNIIINNSKEKVNKLNISSNNQKKSFLRISFDINNKKKLEDKKFKPYFENLNDPFKNKRDHSIKKDNNKNNLFKDIIKKNITKNLSKDILLNENNKKIIDNNLKITSDKRAGTKEKSNDKTVNENKKFHFLTENAKFLNEIHYEEIKNINEVYYFRETNTEEIKRACIDDFDLHYKINLGDHIFYRYEIVRELGKGSFGQAIKCYDHKRKNYVCVKILQNKEKVYKQSKIEISILEYIKKVDTDESANIIKILSHFVFRNHMCIVFELLEQSVYDLLKYSEFNGVSIITVKKFAYQILSSLDFLQKHKIIHCDLKPENILLKKKNKTGIRIIDFGSSCFEDKKLYSYLQTRYYRAPEIILGCNYGIEIDLWSFGCIIVELYSGNPIFSGENEIDQLNYIMQYLGLPPREMIENSKRKHKFFNEQNEPLSPKNSKQKIRKPNSKKLEDFLGIEDKIFIDFIQSFLIWDPKKRIKPEAALLHPFLSDLLKEIEN